MTNCHTSLIPDAWAKYVFPHREKMHHCCTWWDIRVESKKYDPGSNFVRYFVRVSLGNYPTFNIFFISLSDGLHGTLQTIVNEGKLDVHINEVIEDSLIQLEKGSIDLSFMDLSKQVSCTNLYLISFII